MENDQQQKMQFLGLFGIYKESYKLMFSWKKLLNQITLTHIFPLSFNYLTQIVLSNILFGKILYHSNQITKTHFDTLQQQNLIEIIFKEWALLFLIKIAYFVLILAFYIFSTSAVAYTVAFIYTEKDITFNKVMGAMNVPNLWKKLLVTFLCTLVAVFVYNTISFVVAIISAITFGVKTGGIAVFIIIGILYLIGLTYLVVVWQLSNVVTVLEDSYGFEAMMKSKELIKGKIRLSMIITLQFNICFFVIQFLFGMLVVKGSKGFEFCLMNRMAIGFACFLLLSHLFLFILVIQTVLYFVCKSYHHQNIDKYSYLFEHSLKVYQGEYESVKGHDVQLKDETSPV